AIMGSKTGVVIGSGPTGGWTGAVLCEQEGVTSGIGFTTEEVGIGGPWMVTPLRVVIPFKSSLGLVTVLPGSVPDPEVEAVLAVTN
ncbi:hypothetical protein Tco_0050813, partial [Tanacetum coccineum]